MQNNDVKVFDDVLPRGYVDAIEYDLMRTGFHWLYVKDVTNKDYGSNSGFVHPAYDYGKEPTEWYPFIKPLVYSIEECNGKPLEELYRIRVGFLLPTNEIEYRYNTPHIDFLWQHQTACFYVNESDGDTVVFDQRIDDIGRDINDNSLRTFVENTNFTILKSIPPKKNRLSIFDGFNFHASTKPRESERRLVITVNFK